MVLEFEEAGNLLEANRDATTISIEDDDVQPEKQRKTAGLSPGGDDDSHDYDDSSEVRMKLTLTEKCDFSKIMNYGIRYCIKY